MSFPISLFDATKMNFTLSWDNFKCPISMNSPLFCSPQGGFAVVFQQESQKALGDYRTNLGEGLGYDGLSGVVAIEFDMMAGNHNDQPLNKNLMVAVQVRNPITKLLYTRPSSTIAQNVNPVNYAVSYLNILTYTELQFKRFQQQDKREHRIHAKLTYLRNTDSSSYKWHPANPDAHHLQGPGYRPQPRLLPRLYILATPHQGSRHWLSKHPQLQSLQSEATLCRRTGFISV